MPFAHAPSPRSSADGTVRMWDLTKKNKKAGRRGKDSRTISATSIVLAVPMEEDELAALEKELDKDKNKDKPKKGQKRKRTDEASANDKSEEESTEFAPNRSILSMAWNVRTAPTRRKPAAKTKHRTLRRAGCSWAQAVTMAPPAFGRAKASC